MRMRLVSVDELQFMLCFQHELWGSKSARFGDWRNGDRLVFTVNKRLTALAEVSGKAFTSHERVWSNGTYPNRIPIRFLSVFSPNDRPQILGEVRDVLTAEWGPHYGWGILNQQLLQGKSSETIARFLGSLQNDIEDYRANMTAYLEAAKLAGEKTVSERKPRRKRELNVASGAVEAEVASSKREESEHTKAQDELIRLGRAAGCAVWIASNDRSKCVSGKSIAASCLTKLPNLGLNDEAMKRISLIDVIWIEQNGPVCAFEIETTTSVYSGLLRMSDLISVVPAINISLYIVAPKARQDRVMSELSRPTFQKIGLSDYCRYVATEDLHALVDKIKGLEGAVRRTAIDTIAVEADDLVDE